VMALGKLVVSSNIPAFNEIIIHKQNGFIAKEEKEYEQYIRSIFNAEVEVNTISKHAIQTLKSHLDLKDILKQNINYYKSLL